MQINLQPLKLILILFSAITIQVQAQQISFNLGIQAENYKIQSFDLLNSSNSTSINLIPDVRYDLFFGYKFLEKNTIYLGANIGSLSSRFKVYNEQSMVLGKILIKDRSYQINLSYSYSLLLSEKIFLEPSLILTYNQNSFRKRTPQITKAEENFEDLMPVSRVLASKSLNYYFTGGIGIRFTYKINDRIQLSLLSSYHISFVPNYLLAIYGTVRNDSIVENIRQELILSTGARLSNSLSFGYIIKSYR